MKVLFSGPDPEPIIMKTAGEDRPAGLHLSDITSRMAWEWYQKYDPDKPADLMDFEQGFTWEYVLEHSLSARHTRPGYRPKAIQRDGIWLSPDWVNPDGDGVQHEEWKATKRSTKWGFDELGRHWILNTKGYLYALLEAQIVEEPRTRFRVWHINGDYKRDSKPAQSDLFRDYWIYDVEFTRDELKTHWESVLAYGVKFGLLTGGKSCRATRPPENLAPVTTPVTSPTEVMLRRSLQERAKRSSKTSDKSSKPARRITFPPSRSPRKSRGD